MKKCFVWLLTLVLLVGMLPAWSRIVADEVSEEDTGILWKLLDVPETESFYNYAKKNVGWLTRLGMSKSTDPLSQEATYTSGDPSGLFTRKSGDEYFVIFNPREEYDGNGKLKEANGGVMYNTLSGRGLTEDGEAKMGVPEGITAADATYMAIRFKITGGTAEQYSSVSFRLGDAGFIALTNAYLIDKTTGTVSEPHFSGNLLGITGEFDGWLMIPWDSLSLSQSTFIQSTGGTIQCYFHSELCTTASHGKDTASDWHDKILWLGDVMLVDDEAQFLKTYAPGESDTGVFWKLLDVPETESFYNYANKHVGWLTRLGMSKSTDPLSQEATYTSGDPSGLFTRKSGDEYFVIFNPREEYDGNGKLKEANGGVMYNTLSGRGLAEDGEAKMGVPEGITAADATYMAIRFKITGGTAEQYSSVSFRLGDASFIVLTNAYLIDKTTGAVSNPNLSGNLLGITGEFDGWLMIPWHSLYLAQREFIQSTGGTIQCYFHSELCTTASHGKDTASDWREKILWLGDVMLVDDEAQFLKTYADKVVAEKGMTFSDSDMHVIRGAFQQMPNTFEATMRFPADYHPSFRGGVVIGNNGYKRENLNFQIAANGHPQIYARHDGTAYTMTFDEVNVYTGESTHIAIVNDSQAQTMTCYVNGVAAQTIEGYL